jgi:ferritin-like metal-binding protein YciE
MSTTNSPARDAKLVHYLGEAYGSEKRRQAALAAHIATATRAPYKRRLQQHLGESRRHASALSRRMRQLHGSPAPLPAVPGVPAPLGGAAEAVIESAQKATALARGPLRVLRGEGEAEQELRSARSEYAQEAQEIGMYSALETFAGAVADKETEALAREILRDERRMLAFLEREIPRLSTAVARAEIPASQRNGAARSARKASPNRRSAAARSTRLGGARSAARGSRTGAARSRARG